MSYILSILAGVVQGLTEFLPVSSSGHLVLFHEILNFKLPSDLAFDVMLHLGTFLALGLFFYQEIWRIIKGFISSLTNWDLKNNFDQRLAWLIIVGTIPAATIGFFFEDLLTGYFRRPVSVAMMLILVAGLIWLFEKYSSKLKQIKNLNWRDALIIGGAQVLALIPGASRSGITIVAGLGIGLTRAEAARYSFLLSAPIIFGAGMKKTIFLSHLAGVNWPVLIIGLLTATVVGYLTIKYFLRYLANHSLNIFVWYRLTIGVLALLWFLLI